MKFLGRMIRKEGFDNISMKDADSGRWKKQRRQRLTNQENEKKCHSEKNISMLTREEWKTGRGTAC